MASALEAVLALKQQEAARQQQQSDNLTQGLQMLQQARQQAISNQFAQLQYKAGLAEKGLIPDASSPSGFKYDASTQNPLSQYMIGLKMQADAKTAGNKQAYDSATGFLNNLMGGSNGQSNPQIPQASPIPQGSPVAQAIAPTDQATAPVPTANAVASPTVTPSAPTAQSISDTASPSTIQKNAALANQPDYTSQIDSFTGKPTLQSELQQNALKVQQSLDEANQKFGDEQARGFANASAKLQLTMENWHKMVQSTQDQFGVAPGRTSGVLSKLGGVTGTNPYYTPFKTSLLESEVQMAKLSAPSARIGPDLIKIFGQIAPTEFSNPKESKQIYINSLTNAFSTYATANKDKFPDGANIDQFQEYAGKLYDNLMSQAALSSQFKEGQSYNVKGGNKVITFKGGRFFDENGKPVNVGGLK